MKRKHLLGIGLVAGIVLTWVLFTAFVAWSIGRLDQRAYELGSLALDDALELQANRLDARLHGLERDLGHQAAVVQGRDTFTVTDVLVNWMPLLRTGEGIHAIGLASETGEDLELRRSPDGWRLTQVSGTGEEELSFVTTWPLDSPYSGSLAQIGEHTLDPRSTPWFGKALEAGGALPSWSFSDPSAPIMLYVSRKIHERTGDEAYRILRFELDPGLLLDAVNVAGSAHPIMLTRIGRPLHSSLGPVLNTLEAGAIAGWNSLRSRIAFRFNSGGREHIARFVPHVLSGNTLTCGAVLPMAPIAEQLAPERTMLWTSAFFLLVLGVLLTIALVRGLRSYEQVQQHELQSRTQQRALARAVDERETLDREVHHRVKNNLQVVSSLLNLQAQRIASPGARLEFIRGKRRIDSMALVHHKLYTQKDLAKVDLRIFLTQVGNAVSAMHEPRSRSISHAVDTHDILADADTAIQLGLILCELLGNCYQHAFPYVTGGHVDIVVDRRTDDQYVLSVIDNGRGMETGTDRNETELGLEIVEGLADQIDGTMTVNGNSGTRVDVTFRMQGRPGVRPL
jgi:two-component sensor histidine kinase